MSKQTAVEWFYDKIKSHFEHDGDLLETLTFTMAIAKKMEREQIEKSYTSGREQWQKYEIAHCNYENDVEVPTPRKYYNETYGGKDESNH